MVQNSIQHYVYSSADANCNSMTPNFSPSDAPLPVESAQAAEIVEFFEEIDAQTTNEMPKKAPVVSAEPNPLEIIQRDLEVMVMGDEAGELAITTCVANIVTLQTQAQAQNEKTQAAMVPEKSLAYYMALATDFTKLVRFIV